MLSAASVEVGVDGASASARMAGYSHTPWRGIACCDGCCSGLLERCFVVGWLVVRG